MTLKSMFGDKAYLFRKRIIKIGSDKFYVDAPLLQDILVGQRQGIVILGQEYSLYTRDNLTQIILKNLPRIIKRKTK